MDNRTTDVSLHLPEGMAYTCHSEGVCCHVFDTIPLDANAAAALAGLDHSALNAAASNSPDAPVTAPNPAGPSADKMARKACGDCAMLTAEKLCAIHAMAGEAAKPRVCQDFPWRYVETPDGVYVGLSFVCPSVRGNRGQLVTEQSATLTQRYSQSGSVREAQSLVPLNGRVTLRWRDYMAVESAISDILVMENEPLPIRLIAMCMIPGFVDQMLAHATKELHSSGSSSRASDDAAGSPLASLCPAGVVEEVIQAMCGSHYKHVLQVARKATPPAARSRRMFLGMFTSFANTLHQRGQGRFSTVAGVMNQYVRHAAGIGSVTLQPVNVRLSHAQLDKSVVPPDGYAAEQIGRYISHCVFRKDLTLSGDLTRRVRLLALNAALIPWYATALAAAAGHASPSDGDWDEAIGHVERLYGFHSAFYKFFEQNKIFSDIVDSFILKPSYPFAMFR